MPASNPESKRRHDSMFVGKDIPEDGEIVAAIVILKRDDGTYGAWSGADRFAGRDTQLPGYELRADLHDMVSTAFTIANL